MHRLQIAVGGALILLGLVVSWIGLNLLGDFADLGQVAVSRGDDGSLGTLVLIPCGLLVAAAGVAAIIAASRRPRTER